MHRRDLRDRLAVPAARFRALKLFHLGPRVHHKERHTAKVTGNRGTPGVRFVRGSRD